MPEPSPLPTDASAPPEGAASVPAGERLPVGAEFPAAAWTSFDRYSRYAAIARAVRANLGPGRHRVLDVGDSSGYLAIFDPGLEPVCADLVMAADPLPGTVRVNADGAFLPFPGGSFDAVVSSDALEHVPAGLRAAFLAEVCRVTTDLVVVAAPFATAGVEGAEALARRFVTIATGEPQDQLEEHHERGLPRVDDTVGAIERAGLSVRVRGNGNLHDWLLLMLLKHQIAARPAIGPLDFGYDVAYNLALSGRNEVGPFYRHVVVGRRRGAPGFGAQPGALDASPADAVPLIGAWLSATVAEATRQDIATLLSDLSERQAALERFAQGLADGLNAVIASQDAAATANAAQHAATQRSLVDVAGLVSDLGVRVADVRAAVDNVFRLIRHPLRAATEKVRRSNRPGDPS